MKSLAFGILIYLILRDVLELVLKLRKLINAKFLGMWDFITSMIIMTVANNTIRDSVIIPQYVFWVIAVLAIINLVFGMVQLYRYICGADTNK